MKGWAGALLIAAATVVGATAATAQTKIKVAYVPAVQLVDAHAAQQKGMFGKRGIEAELVTLGVSANMPAALASNSIDIGAATVPTFLQAVAGGLDLVIVSANSVTDATDANAAFAREGSGIQKPQDFVGKKVGVPGLNAFLHVLFREWLTQKGVEYKRVTFVEAAFPQMSDMLKSSSLDAALAVDPFYTRILNAKSGYVVSHFTAELPPGTAVTLWISTRKWVNANPAVAKGFKEGLVEAQQYVRGNPDEARKIIADFTKLPPPVIEAMRLGVLRTETTEPQLQYWIDLMTKQEMINTRPDLKTLVMR